MASPNISGIDILRYIDDQLGEIRSEIAYTNEMAANSWADRDALLAEIRQIRAQTNSLMRSTNGPTHP